MVQEMLVHLTQKQGVLYAEIAAIANSITNRRITLSNGADNRIYIGYKNYTNQVRVEVIASASSVFDSTVSISDITNYIKIAVFYKQNNFKLYIDGSVVATDTSGNTPIGLNDLGTDCLVGTMIFMVNAKI
jgi:hypothetical protein